MTMDTSHLDDDALSASLDDALEDAAGQSHLAGCAICAARRDQLAAARSALAAAPVEPVDELTRRRLVTTALAEAGPAAHRKAWYQRPALAGGVAAVLLALIAAVPFVTGGDNSGDQQAATAALDRAGSEFLGDLGDLSDPSALRERFGAQRSLALSEEAKATGEADAAGGSGAAEAPKAATAPPLAPVSGRPAKPVPAAPTAGAATDTAAEPYAQSNQSARDEAAGGGLDRTVAEACARTLAGDVAQGSSLLAVATGTYHDTPAVVAVFSGERGTTAYVAARDGCRLLIRYQV
jgi:hypothetical protein